MLLYFEFLFPEESKGIRIRRAKVPVDWVFQLPNIPATPGAMRMVRSFFRALASGSLLDDALRAMGDNAVSRLDCSRRSV